MYLFLLYFHAISAIIQNLSFHFCFTCALLMSFCLKSIWCVISCNWSGIFHPDWLLFSYSSSSLFALSKLSFFFIISPSCSFNPFSLSYLCILVEWGRNRFNPARIKLLLCDFFCESAASSWIQPLFSLSFNFCQHQHNCVPLTSWCLLAFYFTWVQLTSMGSD